jgi:hypothetical protein
VKVKVKVKVNIKVKEKGETKVKSLQGERHTLISINIITGMCVIVR